MPEPPMEPAAPQPAWLSTVVRALALLALAGLSCGFALAVVLWIPSIDPFLTENQISPRGRRFLLGFMIAGCVAAVGAGATHLARARDDARAATRLDLFARRIAPLCCVGFVPMLFRWHTWQERPLVFLILVSLFSMAVATSVRVFLQALPEDLDSADARGLAARIRRRVIALPPWTRRVPLALVVAAAAAYVVIFSYYTIAFHYGVWSGFDLGIKNNIFWNSLHGAFLKASPTLGPNGPSHFGRHADFLVYALLPIYFFFQRAETILVLQSLFTGAAAIPLYFLCRRRVGPWASALIALAYLLHPAIHGANIFEFHFVLFGLPLLFTAWLFLEQGRFGWGAVFVALTLLTREDVSVWVVILGGYLVLSGERPRAGIVTAAVGAVYFVVVKFFLMPLCASGETFTFIYNGLFPPDDTTFLGVLKTLVGNPAFTLSTLLKEDKLVYLLQILLPTAFLALRRPIWLWLAVPGFLFTVLAPNYQPVYSIAFQYSPHWIAFMMPGIALGVAWVERRRPPGNHFRVVAMAALVAAALPVSYQFGAVLQHHTAMAGPRPFRFGIDDMSRRRHEAIRDIDAVLPRDAKVACSALVTPQFSSRADDYDMNQGFFDAEFLVFPTDRDAFIANEKAEITRRLRSGEFGVLKIHQPFAIAKRGYRTDLNGQLLSLLHEP